MNLKNVQTYLQRTGWLYGVVLAILLLSAYGNTFHVPFLFDDSGSIAENETIRSFATGFFPGGNSGNTVSGRPVLNVTLALNYWICGDQEVVGYHVMNLIIHTLATLTLFGVVRRTLGVMRARNATGATRGLRWLTSDIVSWTAFVVAALWGLHPLATESVTYVIQRAESLVGLFYWLTLYCFVRAVDHSRVPGRWLIASTLACLLGMGSKEVMVGAPIVVFLFDRAFVAGSFREAWRCRWRYYVALGATWLLLALCIFSTGKRGDTVGFNEYATWWRYALTQGFAIVHYLKLSVWPYPQVLDYGQQLSSGQGDGTAQTAIVSVLALISLGALWKFPKVGTICAFFFIVLAPSSSFVPVLTQTMAEHRMYLAVASIIILLVFGSLRLMGWRVLFLWAGVIVVFAVMTYKRNSEYATKESIWATVTARCPYNPRGWGSLGAFYLEKGDVAKAKKVLREGIEYSPTNVDILADYAGVLNMLKDYDEAIAVLKYALTLQPDYYKTNDRLGTVYLDKNEPLLALIYYEKAMKSQPDNAGARYGMGKAYLAVNRLPEAVAIFSQLIKEDPNADAARNNLANALLNMGRTTEAEAVLSEGLRVTPKSGDLERTMGLLLLTDGKTSEAILHLNKALVLQPKDAKAHANLALALAQQGQASEARKHYETALQEGKDEPTDVIVALHASAAQAAQQVGDTAAAAGHYEAILKLDPNIAQAHYELAVIYIYINRNHDALLELKEAVRLQPEFAEATALLRRISKD